MVVVSSSLTVAGISGMLDETGQPVGIATAGLAKSSPAVPTHRAWWTETGRNQRQVLKRPYRFAELCARGAR